MFELLYKSNYLGLVGNISVELRHVLFELADAELQLLQTSLLQLFVQELDGGGLRGEHEVLVLLFQLRLLRSEVFVFEVRGLEFLSEVAADLALQPQLLVELLDLKAEILNCNRTSSWPESCFSFSSSFTLSFSSLLARSALICRLTTRCSKLSFTLFTTSLEPYRRAP